MAISGHASDDAVIVTMVIGSVFAAFACAARLFTRGFIVRNAGLDDVFICAACLVSIIHTVVTCKRVQYGMGDKQRTLSDEEMTNAYFWFWVSIWVYYSGLFCVKISILLQYLRIFVQRKFRFVCYALIAIVVVCSLWAIFSGAFMCTPVKSFWDHTVAGRCLDRLAVTYSTAIINVLTDFATALLPLPMIKTLPIPKHQRILLLAVFGVGFSTCIVSVLRLVWLFPVSVAKDMTYESPLSALWSNVELNTGILCSCIPTLKSCLAALFPTLFPEHHQHQQQLQQELSNKPDPNLPWSPKSSSSSSPKEMTAFITTEISANNTPELPPYSQAYSPASMADRKRPLTYISCGGLTVGDATELELVTSYIAPSPIKTIRDNNDADVEKALPPSPQNLTALPPTSDSPVSPLSPSPISPREKRANFSWPERWQNVRAKTSPGKKRESMRALVRAARESVLAESPTLPRGG